MSVISGTLRSWKRNPPWSLNSSLCARFDRRIRATIQALGKGAGCGHGKGQRNEMTHDRELGARIDLTGEMLDKPLFIYYVEATSTRKFPSRTSTLKVLERSTDRHVVGTSNSSWDNGKPMNGKHGLFWQNLIGWTRRHAHHNTVLWSKEDLKQSVVRGGVIPPMLSSRRASMGLKGCIDAHMATLTWRIVDLLELEAVGAGRGGIAATNQSLAL